MKDLLVICGAFDDFEAAGYPVPSMQGDALFAVGYCPRISTAAAMRWVFLDESCENWLRRDELLWRSCFPDPISLIGTAGWPELGRPSAGLVGLDPRVYLPCEDCAVRSAVFENPDSSVWELELLGSVRFEGCFPRYQRYVRFDCLDIGISPLFVGDVAYIEDVLGAAERYFRGVMDSFTVYTPLSRPLDVIVSNGRFGFGVAQLFDPDLGGSRS